MILTIANLTGRDILQELMSDPDSIGWTCKSIEFMVRSPLLGGACLIDVNHFIKFHKVRTGVNLGEDDVSRGRALVKCIKYAKRLSQYIKEDIFVIHEIRNSVWIRRSKIIIAEDAQTMYYPNVVLFLRGDKRCLVLLRPQDHNVCCIHNEQRPFTLLRLKEVRKLYKPKEDLMYLTNEGLEIEGMETIQSVMSFIEMMEQQRSPDWITKIFGHLHASRSSLIPARSHV